MLRYIFLFICVCVSVQRRLALELEVKRNERIQSEHKLLAHPFHNANMKVMNS